MCIFLKLKIFLRLSFTLILSSTNERLVHLIAKCKVLKSRNTISSILLIFAFSYSFVTQSVLHGLQHQHCLGAC